jgi:hypothetical protein
MARAGKDTNHSNEDRIVILQGDRSSTNKYYHDLLLEKLGTTRKSEVIAKIGDTNIPYEELINNYLDSL